MAKTQNQILEQLGLSDSSDLNSLLDKLAEYTTVKNSELLGVKSISVKPLPTVVVNQEDMVKKRMYGIVTDEDQGVASLLNKRIALLAKIIELLNDEDFEIKNTLQIHSNQISDLEDKTSKRLKRISVGILDGFTTLEEVYNTLIESLGDINDQYILLDTRGSVTNLSITKIAKFYRGIDGYVYDIELHDLFRGLCKKLYSVKDLSSITFYNFINDSVTYPWQMPTGIGEYIEDKITKLIGGAPETLDTLGKLATFTTDNKIKLDNLQFYTENKIRNYYDLGDISNFNDLKNYTQSGIYTFTLNSMRSIMIVETQQVSSYAGAGGDITPASVYQTIITRVDDENLAYSILTFDGSVWNEKVNYIATEEYVNTAVANLVNSAPSTLDTLGELAMALQQNQDVVKAVNESIATKANKSDVDTLNATVQENKVFIDEQISYRIPNYQMVDGGNVTLGSIYDDLHNKFGDIDKQPILLKIYGVNDFTGFIEFRNNGFPAVFVDVHNIHKSSSKTARIANVYGVTFKNFIEDDTTYPWRYHSTSITDEELDEILV